MFTSDEAAPEGVKLYTLGGMYVYLTLDVIL